MVTIPKSRNSTAINVEVDEDTTKKAIPRVSIFLDNRAEMCEDGTIASSSKQQA